jgi:hypothetical protein
MRRDELAQALRALCVSGTGTSMPLLALCCGLLAPLAHAAPCIWFSDGNSIQQLNTDDNSILAEAPLRHPSRLVMNDNDCSVWAVGGSDKLLIRFDAEGKQNRRVAVRNLDPRLDSPFAIRLDPFDNSLWLADERRISHFDADAKRLLGAFTAPGEIRRFRVGMDQNLWLLGKHKLWRVNRQGKILDERVLDRVVRGEARHFHVDELRGTIWVAGEHQIARLDLNGTAQWTVISEVREAVRGFTLDPISGRVWFGRRGRLEALNPDGTPFAQVDLRDLGLRAIKRIGFDPASRSLWAGIDRTLVRFDDIGQPVGSLPDVQQRDDQAFGMPPFIVTPRLVLQRPPENGVVSARRPRFTLEYGAQCNGGDCDTPDTYLSSLGLVASLNGVSVGRRFVFDPDTKSASLETEAALPEGVSTFSARLTDRFGHKSNRIETTITLDTIPPEFAQLNPPAGAVLAAPQATLQGAVSEPRVSVVLENAQALNPRGANPQFPQPPGLGFSWDLTLRPGSNPIQLTAVDAAGNAKTTIHTLILSGAPEATIVAPVNGASIADDNVTVTGTWSGPPNTGIAVNGVVAAISGNEYFASIRLSIGSNSIVTTATAPDGTQKTVSVQVTSAGAGATKVVAAPRQGVAPLNVLFTVTSDRPIQSVDGNFSTGYQTCGEEGCWEQGGFYVESLAEPLTFTYDQPGAYLATFNVSHKDGTAVTKTVRIVVQSADQIDQQLRQVWSGFAAALVRGDKPAAMQYFNVQARAKFGDALDVLMPEMPQILGTFSDLLSVTLTGEIGEYAVSRTLDGVNRVFLIYLLRDGDGVWRIDSM